MFLLFGRLVTESTLKTTKKLEKIGKALIEEVFHFEVPEHVLFEVTFHFTPEIASLKSAVKMRLLSTLEFPVSVQGLLMSVTFKAIRTEKVPSIT